MRAYHALVQAVVFYDELAAVNARGLCLPFHLQERFRRVLRDRAHDPRPLLHVQLFCRLLRQDSHRIEDECAARERLDTARAVRLHHLAHRRRAPDFEED